MPAGGLMGHHTGMQCRKGKERKACASARRAEKALALCRETYQVWRPAA